jgi:hypothetical protein
VRPSKACDFGVSVQGFDIVESVCLKELCLLMRSTLLSWCLLLTATCGCFVGCNNDAEKMQAILSKQRVEKQEVARQDHLGDAVALLDQYVLLNEQKAQQQITYHINQWLQEYEEKNSDSEQASPAKLPEIAKTLQNWLAPEMLQDVVMREDFTIADVPLLRDANIYRHVLSWIDSPVSDDPLFKDWLADLRAGKTGDLKLEPRDIDRLQTAMRLFDWMVRNVALESDQLPSPPQLQVPPLPPGIVFEGPGYRQNDYQTLWRGRGDWLQRCGVFTQLCTQAGIPSAVLATQSDETGSRTPWAVGVLIGEEIFLFEPRLGLPIPGPDQTGVATLTQARKDASVMRRLDVAGFHDYPLSRTDISPSVALLNVRAETMSPRLKKLESGLTGDRRMVLWVDADDWGQRFDAVTGIADAAIWEMPTIAEGYAQVMEMIAERDPAFSFWYKSRFAVLEAVDSKNNNLAKGRLRHLTGQFVDDELEANEGARTHYLNQRAPEYEIDDLRINVELQKQYGLRRELGIDPAQYDVQLTQMQSFMRLGKRTATYWLALVQYDDGRYDTAHNWFSKRVLDAEQLSYWNDGAVYNSARASEGMGDIATAVETLKTDRSISNHGNRLRARLLDKTLGVEEE